MPRSKSSAFTLSELLIALAILGIIATFTIPKVLQSQQNGKKFAILKETISAYSSAAYDAYQQGKFQRGICAGVGSCTSTSWPMNFTLKTKLNAVKFCTQAETEGCYMDDPTDSCADNAGNVLANGASTCGIKESSSNPDDGFYIDWNGTSPPNIMGDDQLKVMMCVDAGCGGGQRPGTITQSGNAASQALFEQTFK